MSDLSSGLPAQRKDPLRYYRPELDVLRFFAFFLVFLSHVVPGEAAFYARAHIPPAVGHLLVDMAAGGAFGVDLFFALSSFLITSLLLRERRARGEIDVASFYIRRVLRIWPLYFVFLLVVTPLLQGVLPGESMPVKYTLAYALLSGNWACAAWGFPHSVAEPLWSVSVEEQFYLSWPLIMRRWTRQLAAIACALWAVSLVARSYLVFRGVVHPQIWCNTLARLDPIAAGALLALFALHKEFAFSGRARVIAVVFGIAVLTVAGSHGDFVGTKALVTFPAVTVACIALILGVLNSGIASDRRSTARVLVYFGKISYGLYVFHLMFVMIFQVPTTAAPAARVARIAAALLATMVTAAASYHFLERPFLRLKERFTRVESRPA
jgi:peptidoglycan/LPS O-acetylase OafA/YrhL